MRTVIDAQTRLHLIALAPRRQRADPSSIWRLLGRDCVGLFESADEEWVKRW